ncbi:MAG TPA: BglII/BstYI family type II restriction endonuclease [Candidatus Rubrimentiphilum sp.]|nr:BglII/BstYI family type II restriction endonuclease [Candidatus Rubrimentiphilum sp.]
MKYKIFNYRHAREIICSAPWHAAFDEIEGAIQSSPLFLYANKSSKNPRFDVVQQVQNTFFDRRLSLDYGWDYHPSATGIKESELTADFRKKFVSGTDTLSLQVEVQFGNMSRWYSDVFKFQAAYSADLIQMGVSIVPTLALANRIGDNIVSFERCVRELPAAKLSITHPILLLGIEPDESTATYDLSKTKFGALKEVSGQGKTSNRYRIVNAFLDRVQETDVGPLSPTGPMPKRPEIEEEEQDPGES